jgi:hypothetical protein
VGTGAAHWQMVGGLSSYPGARKTHVARGRRTFAGMFKARAAPPFLRRDCPGWSERRPTPHPAVPIQACGAQHSCGSADPACSPPGGTALGRAPSAQSPGHPAAGKRGTRRANTVQFSADAARRARRRPMAATNKCLAQNNKSRHVSRATKDTNGASIDSRGLPWRSGVCRYAP